MAAKTESPGLRTKVMDLFLCLDPRAISGRITTKTTVTTPQKRRRPSSRTYVTGSIPWAPVTESPFKHIQVPFRGGPDARRLTPLAAIVACPLQDFQVPRPRRFRACGLVPRAVVRSQPLEDVQMSPPSCGGACGRIAGTTVLFGPL